MTKNWCAYFTTTLSQWEEGVHVSTKTVTPTCYLSYSITTTTTTTGSRSKVHSYRGKELTFGKPLICSPARKEGRGIEEGGEKEGTKREERMTEQEEERAFTVSKRKAAITSHPVNTCWHPNTAQHCCHHTEISNVTCQVWRPNKAVQREGSSCKHLYTHIVTALYSICLTICCCDICCGL